MAEYPQTLTTGRLLAQRPDVERDLDEYAAILGDPRVADPLFPAQFGAVLDADRWGRGYATELVHAALEHATALKREPANERAVSLLGRTGFAFERELDFHGLDVVVHRAATGRRRA